MPEQPERGRFGQVVLLGLATAALAAVAATRPWVDLPGQAPTGAAFDLGGAASPATTFPAASAVSLVLLAAWGVLLVTRGRVRRGFALVAVVAAAGLLACVATAAVTLPASAAASVVPTPGAPGGAGEASYTPWFWVAGLGALLAVPPAALAVLWSPRWPEMGRRYDAPADAATPTGPAGPDTTAEPAEAQSERDLWRSLDEGRDPTS